MQSSAAQGAHVDSLATLRTITKEGGIGALWR